MQTFVLAADKEPADTDAELRKIGAVGIYTESEEDGKAQIMGFAFDEKGI